MYKWLGILSFSLCTCAYIPSDAATLDIPDDFTTAVNHLGFVANLAQECDLRLSVFSTEALWQAACTNFLAQGVRIAETWGPNRERWMRVAQGIDASRDARLQRRWASLWDEAAQALGHIKKAREHVEFQRALLKPAKKAKAPR